MHQRPTKGEVEPTDVGERLDDLERAQRLRCLATSFRSPVPRLVLTRTTMSIFNTIVERFRKESFLPTWLGIVVNPFYILRAGLAREIRAAAPLIQGKVLDIGCGSKPYESLFEQANHYVGLDVPVSGHVHADSHIDCFYDGKRLPFASDAFDAVVSFEVFEHVADLDGLLTEIHRVLKPQAVLLVSMPFSWNEHEVPYDFRRLTSFGMRALLQDSGFEVQGVNKTTTYFLTVCQMLIAYFYQYLFVRGRRVMARPLQVLVVFPMTLIALMVDWLLPSRDEYFCNTVAIARKKPVAS